MGNSLVIIILSLLIRKKKTLVPNLPPFRTVMICMKKKMHNYKNHPSFVLSFGTGKAPERILTLVSPSTVIVILAFVNI